MNLPFKSSIPGDLQAKVIQSTPINNLILFLRFNSTQPLNQHFFNQEPEGPLRTSGIDQGGHK